MITHQFTRLGARARLSCPRPSARFALHKPSGSKFSGIRLSSNAAKQDAQNAATSPKDFVSKSQKPLYPERLLIYNAGTGKTTYIAFTKLGTIVLFAFGCLVIAPRLYADPASPWWAAPAAIILSPLPLLLTATATSPFVNSIYLHLPPTARLSRTALSRFTSSPPPSTRLDLRTIRLNGFWQTTGTTIAELRPLRAKGWLGGLANYERVGAAGGKGKVGVVGGWRRRRFFVDVESGQGGKRTRVPGVVEEVMKAVGRQGGQGGKQHRSG